ncbi:MAG: 4-alpha-glucanotransferase, partial [Nitrospirota bacterium]
MKSHDELIHELAALCGIVPEYWDIFGNKHITAIETKKSILGSMKLRIDTHEETLNEIERFSRNPWIRLIEPVHVISVNELPMKIPVSIRVSEGEEKGLSVIWTIQDEKGQVSEHGLSGDDIVAAGQHWIDGRRYIRINLTDNERREAGYYNITVECRHPAEGFFGAGNSICKKGRIIIAPDTCYIPPELEKGKTWGLSANLYAVRSSRNWGIGDFTDLKDILAWTAGLKGGFVGINPLHAIPNTKPYGISPYSPITRLYKNFIYLDLESIPEVIESSKAISIMRSQGFKRELNRRKKADLIDYEKMAAIKNKALKPAFENFYENHFKNNTLRSREFKQFLSEEGKALELFALYMALWEYMKKKEKAYAWRNWPEAYHTPDGEAVREFREKHEKEILFYQYVQWLIHEQLQDIIDLYKSSGMPVGLYHDLAIGAIGGGSDVWGNQDLFGDADVGAPPDDFSPEGQNWGFPPMIPWEMKETAYDLFIQTMQKNMKYGGAIRIDHALGIFRLFWIPGGSHPSEGAYVECPYEDLLKIIALESVRNRTMVIAEDLGTIGDNVREAIKKYNMLSYRLFYFERNYPDPSFVPPDKYPEMALCSVTTHDLPTIYGYWVGQDIKLRKELGKYADEDMFRQQLDERERDKGLILSTLKSQGILNDDFPSDIGDVPEMTPELCNAIYEYLARTPCRLVLVSLDDIIGTLNQQNMPGTVDAHPNWIQKIPVLLEDMMKDKRFSELAAMFR